MDAGHEVRLAGPGYASELVLAHGLEFVPVGPYVATDVLAVAVDHMVGLNDPIRSARVLISDFVAPSIAPTLEDLRQLAGWPDALISHYIQPAGRLFAQDEEVPWVSVTFAPFTLPTGTRPPGLFPNLGRWSNAFLWSVGRLMLRYAVDPPLNRALRDLGREPLRDGFSTSLYSHLLNLIPVSRHVFPAPHDWPAFHQLTGYWYADPPDETPAPDAGLAAFLASGPPPVAITFGSMATAHVAETGRILAAAIRAAGVRAVVQSGWAGLAEGLESDAIHVVGDLPHGQLFSFCRAVVQHGGAGTTAAAVRAGLPQVVVAHLADQSGWGQLMVEIGVAPTWLARKGLEPERLARAIRAIAEEAVWTRRARALAAAVASESGIAEAVRLIESALEAPTAAS
jgi:UDP:flavonoid glycosyltransferase YjiC (YdhE family)